MIDEHAPYLDHAKRILADDPSLDNSDRADLWDIFHSSRDTRELATRLNDADIPQHVAESLIDAKRLTEPKAEPAEPNPAMDALNKLEAIDEKVLQLAESHPTVLKALLREK
jgi:hypothetical protein